MGCSGGGGETGETGETGSSSATTLDKVQASEEEAEESISVLHSEDYSPSQECRIREQKAMMALLDRDDSTDLFRTPGKSQPSQGTAPTPPAEQDSPMDESDKDKMAEENRNRISRKMGCLRQPETQVLVTQWTTIIISPCT